MSAVNRIRVFAVAFLAISFSLSLTAQNVKVSEWKHLYIGIDQATGSIDGADASQAYAVRVDLRAPGISFYTTPHQGSLNTIATTTGDFLKKFGLQVAVNANFFAPCCNATAEEKTVLGLAVSDGNTVAVPNSIPGQNAALVITRNNQSSIEETTEQTDLTNVFNAVTGSGIIVQDGVNVGAQTPYGDGADPNPRTSMGLSQNGRFLYIVVIDGRQPGYSIGTKSVETAALMLAFGAYTAINLDGGGSTDLVEDDGHGGATIVNRPSGGAERFDANQLGIHAWPLSLLEDSQGLGQP
jgi:exopolysaccharide biosynthesis protein